MMLAQKILNGPGDNRRECVCQNRQVAEVERIIGADQFCHPQTNRAKPQGFNKGRDQANQFFAGVAQQQMQLAAVSIILPPETAPVESLIYIGPRTQNQTVPIGAEWFGIHKRMQESNRKSHRGLRDLRSLVH